MPYNPDIDIFPFLPGNSSSGGVGSSASGDQVATIFDLISEGEIEGLVSGASSVYLDGTPIVDEDIPNGELPIRGRSSSRGSSSSRVVIADANIDLTTLNLDTTRFISIEQIDTGAATVASAGAINYRLLTRSSGRTFTAGDVGRPLVAIGAGLNGQHIHTVVTRYISTTRIMVRDPIQSGTFTYYLGDMAEITSVISPTELQTDTTFGTAFVDSPWTILPPAVDEDTEIDTRRNYESASFFFRTGHLNQAMPPQSFGAEGTAFGQDFGEELFQATRTGTYAVSGADATIKDAITDMGVSAPEAVDEVKIILQFPSMIIYQRDGDRRPNSVEFQIYFEYLRNGTWYNSDGKLPTDTSARPLYGHSDDIIQTRAARGDDNTFNQVDIWALRPGQSNNGTVSRESTSEFVKEYRWNIEQYKPFTNWRVRIKRVTADETAIQDHAQGQHRSFLSSIFAYTNDKLNYPLSAYAGVRFQANEFSKIPDRAYLVRGLKIQVPTNYITREEASDGVANYKRNITTGYEETVNQAWDGKFRGDNADTTWRTDRSHPNYNKVYCNNPAWIYYDIMVNNRYGLGNYLSSQEIDKFALYRIARYCDELVPDGKGGEEPRFTCNLYITSSQEAYKILADLASVFRGILLWMEGSISMSQDRPKSPVYTFTAGNVIGGNFNYETSSKRQRTNQVNVTWVDPEKFYKSTVEIVEDHEAIIEQGRIINKDVVAIGCTSQGQAHRLGKWMLLTERLESRFVKFTTAINAGFLRPGEIVNIQDSHESNWEASGRVANANNTTTNITLDRNVTFNSGDGAVLHIVFPGNAAYLQDSSAVINSVTYYKGARIAQAGQAGSPSSITTIDSQQKAANAVDDAGNLLNLSWFEHSRVETQPLSDSSNSDNNVNVSSAFSSAPDADSIWGISFLSLDNVNYSVKQYRILNITENDNLTWDISAHEYIGQKFDAVDRGYEVTQITRSPVPLFDRNAVPAVTNVQAIAIPLTDGNEADTSIATSNNYEISVNWDTPRSSDSDEIYRYVSYYEVKHNFTADSTFITENAGASNNFRINSTSIFGEFEVYVRVVNTYGRRSKWVGYTYDSATATISNQVSAEKIEGFTVGGSLGTTLRIDSGTGILSFTPDTFTMSSPLGSSYQITSAPTVDFSDMAPGDIAYLMFDASAGTFHPVEIYTDSVVANAVGVPYNRTYLKLTTDATDGLTDTTGNTNADISTTVTRDTGGSPLQTFTVYSRAIATDTDLTGSFREGALLKLNDAGSPTDSWYGTVQNISATSIVTNEPIHKDFSTGTDIYRLTNDFVRAEDFIIISIVRAASPAEWYLRPITVDAATLGTNIYNEAGDLLRDIDVRNDQAVVNALGALNFNPSMQHTRRNASNALAPAGWYRVNSSNTALPHYEDDTVRDILVVSDGRVTNTAFRVNVDTEYEIVIRWRDSAGSPSSTADLQVAELSTELGDGEYAVGDGVGTGAESGVVELDLTRQDLITNQVFSTTDYITSTATYIPNPQALWASVMVASGSEDIRVDWVVVREKSVSQNRVLDDNIGASILRNSGFNVPVTGTGLPRPAYWYRRLGSGSFDGTHFYWSDANRDTFIIDSATGGHTSLVISEAFRINPLAEYEVVIRCREISGSPAGTLAMYMFHTTASSLAAGKRAISSISTGVMDSQIDTTGTGGTAAEVVAGQALTGSFDIYSYTWTPPRNATWGSLSIYNATSGGAIEIDYVSLREVVIAPSNTISQEPLSYTGIVNSNMRLPMPGDPTRPAAWWIGNGTYAAIAYVSGTNDVMAVPNNRIIVNTAFRVDPDKTYRVSVRAKGSVAMTAALDIRQHYYTGELDVAGGKYALGNAAVEDEVQVHTGVVNILANQDLTTSWQVFTADFQPQTSTTKWVSIGLFDSGVTGNMHIDYVTIEEVTPVTVVVTPSIQSWVNTTSGWSPADGTGTLDLDITFTFFRGGTEIAERVYRGVLDDAGGAGGGEGDITISSVSSTGESTTPTESNDVSPNPSVQVVHDNSGVGAVGVWTSTLPGESGVTK